MTKEPDEVAAYASGGAEAITTRELEQIAEQRSTEEWFAIMRCGLCHRELRRAAVEVSDGSFELRGLPGRCTDRGCQAGFGAGTAHSLEVTMYRRQTPGGPTDAA